MRNDPEQAALISVLERQYEEDKQMALEKQRQFFRRELSKILSQVNTPNTPMTPMTSLMSNLGNSNISGSTLDILRRDSITVTPTTAHAIIGKLYGDSAREERERWNRKCLQQLKSEVVKANALVREANRLVAQIGREDLEFKVTLRIPAHNLSPNFRNMGKIMTEAAVLVSRKEHSTQTWSYDKLESRLVEMRELYEREENYKFDNGTNDPFYAADENYCLIGVANVYLSALFHNDLKIDHKVPIVSQLGEVCGQLGVEMTVLHGRLDMDEREADAGDDNDGSCGSEQDSESSDDESEDESRELVVKFSIKSAESLPDHLSNLVFCQYMFWDEDLPIVVPSVAKIPAVKYRNTFHSGSFRFDHEEEITVLISDEFLEHCMDGAVSIEVWGARENVTNPHHQETLLRSSLDSKTRSIADRWREVCRKVETWVEIMELCPDGAHRAVEVIPNSSVLCGGIHRLRQGQKSLIRVKVRPLVKSGMLPLSADSVISVSVGGLMRAKLGSSKALDSYQEDDLQTLRYKWAAALEKRKAYLEDQLNAVSKKKKSPADEERENNLMDQWVMLTEEYNAKENPEYSDIPGAPANWKPAAGMEYHIPVIFMDLDKENMRCSEQFVGMDSFIDHELDSVSMELPIIRRDEGAFTEAICSWDSSLHDSSLINCVTPSGEVVYMIVKIVVRLSHPVPVDLYLRKRVCLQVYNRGSFQNYLLKKLWPMGCECKATGVTYEVVSSVPRVGWRVMVCLRFLI